MISPARERVLVRRFAPFIQRAQARDVLSVPPPHPVASAASDTGLVSLQTTPTYAEKAYRDAMTKFRRDSRLSRMRRGVKCAAELLEYDTHKDGRLYRPLFVTLTYGPDVLWQPSHIMRFLDLCRKRVARKGEPFRYVWVLELTKRGIPHYHVMIWLRASLRLPAPDRAGLWPYGWSQVQRARSPVGYLIKYASKGDSETRFPKGARLFGCGGLSIEQRAEKRWRALPLYVRVQFNVGDGVRRTRGGGWLSTATGEWVPSAALAYIDGQMKVLLPQSGGGSVIQ